MSRLRGRRATRTEFDTVSHLMPLPSYELAISTLGVSTDSPPRQVIERAAGAGFRAIVIDAARQGVRPRDLDRSARRGLASLLRRLELRLAGIELWIPPAHYASPAHSDRALTSTLSAIDLLAELAGLAETDRALTLTLPAQGADEAITTIAQTAHRAEIRIANAAWPQAPSEENDGDAPIGRCIDPRAISRDGEDPIAHVTACRHAPEAARWAYASRRPEEVIDPLVYASALSVVGFQGAVALDLRDSADPESDAGAALARWRRADPFSS